MPCYLMSYLKLTSIQYFKINNKTSLHLMIPAKIFLQAIKSQIEISSKVRINLIMNSIFYDQIKPFQTKYLCVTTLDTLAVEIQAVQDQEIVGKVTFSDLYKLILQKKIIEVEILPTKDAGWLRQTKLIFTLEPVASFNRKVSTGLSTKRINEAFNEPQPKEFEKTNSYDISFSRRDNFLESSQKVQMEQINKNSSASLEKSQKINQFLFNAAIEEEESLESLAQQREKILGELFGKFKKET